MQKTIILSLTILVLSINSPRIAHGGEDDAQQDSTWGSLNFFGGLLSALPGGSPQVADDAQTFAAGISFFWYPPNATYFSIGSTILYGRVQHDDFSSNIGLLSASFDARIFLSAAIFNAKSEDNTLLDFRPYIIVGSGFHFMGIDTDNGYKRYRKAGVNAGLGFESWINSRYGIMLEPFRFFNASGRTRFWTSMAGLSIAFR